MINQFSYLVTPIKWTEDTDHRELHTSSCGRSRSLPRLKRSSGRPGGLPRVQLKVGVRTELFLISKSLIVPVELSSPNVEDSIGLCFASNRNQPLKNSLIKACVQLQ